MEIQQLQIRDAACPDDVRRVECVLVSAASRFRLADNTATSRVPNTIRSYAEKPGYGFGLGARVVRDLVVVDFNRRSEPSPDFPAAVEHIHSELRRIFGDRVHLPGAAEHIPVYDNAA